MEFDHIIKLSPEELYTKAIAFKESKDYDNYCIYMVMSANYDYKLAEDDLLKDYSGERLFMKQNLSKTIYFYEATEKYGYSANYLGYCFAYGILYKQNYTHARRNYEIGIEKNCKISMQNLMTLFGKDENTKDMLKEYITKYLQFKKENAELIKLKKENDELKTHIMASPEGALYFEAKNNWDGNISKKLN